MGLNNINKDNTVIAYQSDPNDIPEEFKDFKVDIDEKFTQ